MSDHFIHFHYSNNFRFVIFKRRKWFKFFFFCKANDLNKKLKITICFYFVFFIVFTISMAFEPICNFSRKVPFYLCTFLHFLNGKIETFDDLTITNFELYRFTSKFSWDISTLTGRTFRTFLPILFRVLSICYKM